MNLLTLKPLTADLLPAVVDLDRRCLGGLWSIEGYRREIESPNSDLLVLQQEAIEGMGSMEELGGDAVPPTPLQPSSLLGLGCLWSIAEEAHITILAIDPDYRQLGLGQAILYALLLSAHHRGLEWATLEVRAGNAAAIRLYEKFGFREVGRRKGYYLDGEDALILWRSGLQKPEFRLWMQEHEGQIADRLQESNYKISLEPALQTTFT